MNKLSPREAALRIATTLRDRGFAALFAGGCVRDTLLGTEPKDYDVATDARPHEVSGLFPRAQLVGAAFGVVIVRTGGRQVEVATFREDGRYLDGRHPETVTFGTAESDARRRDFTINGMFMDPFDGSILDGVGGRQDLAHRLIRAIGHPEQRFAEDRLRILRAARFAARFGFDIEADTLAAIHRYAVELPLISTERIRMELEAILGHPTRAVGWNWLRKCRLLAVMVPQYAWNDIEAEQVERRLAPLPADCPWPVPLATLFFKETANAAEELCHRLTCSNDVARSVSWLWRTTRRLLNPEPLELADYRFLKADPRTTGLSMLLRSELLATEKPLDLYNDLILRLDRIDASTALPAPFVTGDDLLSLGIPQGPAYGRILETLYRAQLNETIRDRDEALRRAAASG